MSTSGLWYIGFLNIFVLDHCQHHCLFVSPGIRIGRRPGPTRTLSETLILRFGLKLIKKNLSVFICKIDLIKRYFFAHLKSPKTLLGFFQGDEPIVRDERFFINLVTK